MLIRLAKEADIPSAVAIYNEARAFMKASGNPNQWGATYPGSSDISDGIARGTSFVCEEDGEVIATFHFEENADDESYRKIDGEWKNSAPYGAIHRIAVKYHGRGIVDFCFRECFLRFPNLKIDTHRDNIPMQKCLKRAGFEYCGIIYLANGDERLAYQKTK